MPNSSGGAADGSFFSLIAGVVWTTQFDAGEPVMALLVEPTGMCVVSQQEFEKRVGTGFIESPNSSGVHGLFLSLVAQELFRLILANCLGISAETL